MKIIRTCRTTAQKYADEFSTVIFWTSIAFFGIWTEYDQNDFMNRYSALFDAFAYARLGFMAAMLDSLKKTVSSLILGARAGEHSLD
eukprot:tig00000788_g4065.t1